MRHFLCSVILRRKSTFSQLLSVFNLLYLDEAIIPEEGHLFIEEPGLPGSTPLKFYVYFFNRPS